MPAKPTKAGAASVSGISLQIAEGMTMQYSKAVLKPFLILAALVFMLFGTAARALTIIPPGLAPGSQYRLVFVTSQLTSGISTNISTYNTFVTNAANSVPELAALGTTWTAAVSTATVDARDNTGTNFALPGNAGVPFYRLDGLRLATGNAGFWNASFLEHSLSITELGGTPPSSVQSSTGNSNFWVWTGTTTGGTKSTSSPLGSANPVAGVGTSTVGAGAFNWLGLAITPAADAHALYAISGVLTVPVPAPAALWLLVSGVLAAFGFARRQH